MNKFFSNIKKYQKYAIRSAKAELKSEVADSYLNWLWWIIEPVCFMLIYTFIFGYVFHNKTPYFASFVFIGLTAWDFFNRMVKGSVKLITSNRDLVKKVYIPKYILLLAKSYTYLFKMGISMIINAEYAAATEISRILRFPSAIKIDPFAKGKVELLKFKVKPEFKLDGLSVMDIDSQFRCDVLIGGVERGDEVAIPDGKFVIKNGDMVSIIASPANSAEFFRKIGIQTNQVRNTMIVGGGTIAYYLAKLLAAMKIRVKIVEKDKARCEVLTELLDDALILNGDGTDRQLLLEEGLMTAEAFVTLTNMDEENVFLALYAKENSSAKLVTKVNRIAFDELISKLDLGSLIYPKYITADYILQYVRAMQNTIGSNVETLYHILDSRAEALEFVIREESEVTGIPLMNLNLKSNLLIGCINRGGNIKIARGQDCIQQGDTVIVLTSQKGLRDIRDILRK